MKRVGDESPSRTGTGSSSDQKTMELENEINNNKKRMLFRPNKSWGQFKETDYSKYGSVAEEIKKINLRRMEIMNVVPSVHEAAVDEMKQQTINAESEDMPVEKSNATNSTFVSESRANNDLVTTSIPIIILDSDDEDVTPQSQTNAHWKPVLEPAEQLILSEIEIIDGGCPLKQNADPSLHTDDETLGTSDQGDDGDDNEKTQCYVKNEVEDESQRNSFLGEGSKSDENIASDDEETSENGLDDLWKEWGLAIENSKEHADFHDSAHNNSSKEPTEDCEHSLILRDDIGYVCRICGIIQKGIQDIFEFQYKIPRSTRTYKYEPRSKRDKEPLEFISDSTELLGNKVVSGFSAHPRHAKQMRSHQVEGFNFLARNLISDQPSGCILAHAPGSGKTFMIISFIQSFMATYPDARPLIVLPKGILATWKNEFLKWQIEDIPLYDLYSAGADGRSQQLKVLNKWVKQRSILFLGYMQFSSIVSGVGNSETITLCQDILSKVPSLLILDEGHTPRNKDTEVVNSISRVQTTRKVVLSGTLYQNHVQEVFNILDIVHPKFLQSDTPKAVAKRIMSRVGGKRINNGNSSFYDLVERTLQSEDLAIKLNVINDLREMTNNILHYYKGDFLDDLPGLEDFNVKLNLNVRQKNETKKLKRFASVFKRSSVGSAIYVHPTLKQYLEHVQDNGEKQASFDDATIDGLIKEVDIKEGVKAMFFLNVLKLCQITDEKLLVFSQYLLPLKFLERLTCNVMNWSLGREIFMITGDSSAEMREMSMNQFNNSASAKVFFGSIKACGEGVSLVGASRIIILDVHLNPSVSRQAIGRAFRPGQKKKVYVYRLIAAESPEEEDHNTCFRKELVSKMWFEWNEYSKLKDFELKQVDVEDCGDYILESPHIHGDVKALYKR